MIKRSSFFSVLASFLLLLTGLHVATPLIALEGNGGGNDAPCTLKLLRAPSRVNQDRGGEATAPAARALTVRGKPLVLDRLLRSEPFPWVLPVRPVCVSPLYEHQLLVSPHQRFSLKSFIAEQANPPVYALLYNRRPLNIFIFETLHTLPLEALPPHTRVLLEVIAKTKGSRLIGECMAKQDDVKVNIDPRLRLSDSEKQKYPGGRWTACLPPKYEASLKEGLPQGVDLDDINPKFLYLYLSKKRDSLTYRHAKCVQLDDQVQKIFERQKRKITAFEDEETRVEADIENMVSYIDSIKVDFNKDTVSELFCPLVDFLECLYQNETPLYQPTLADLDLGDTQVLTFLRGHYFEDKPTVDTEYRNEHWWKKTIHPLLSERIARGDKKFPPCLFMYGQAHNQNHCSILKKVSQLPGMDFVLWTRQGWQKWSLEDQIIVPVKSLEVSAGVKYLLQPDSYGRNSWDLNYGNSLPNSQLPDQHGRKPGHPLYGDLLSDEQLRAIAIQHGLPADHFHRREEKEEKKEEAPHRDNGGAAADD